jgi:two-component system phosphate regulon sensor histidine kinase PhoR
VLVIYRISRAVTRPIERMTKVAHEISDMNYEARVPMQGDDEIGRLGQAINALGDSLQTQMKRLLDNESRLQSVLDHMISGVLMLDANRRITLVNRTAEDMLGISSAQLIDKTVDDVKLPGEIVRLIGQCVETRDHVSDEWNFQISHERILEIHAIPVPNADGEGYGALVVLHDMTAVRRLMRMRSEFVANVSHELKTPVAAVKGFAETLLSGALEDKEAARPFLKIIYDESDRLDRLIGDLTELSKIESKQVPLRFSPVR